MFFQPAFLRIEIKRAEEKIPCPFALHTYDSPRDTHGSLWNLLICYKKRKQMENSVAKNFLERNSITTFAQLEKFKTDRGKEFDSREQIFIPKWQRLEKRKELAKAYADYEPYKAVHDMITTLHLRK